MVKKLLASVFHIPSVIINTNLIKPKNLDWINKNNVMFIRTIHLFINIKK